MPRMVPTGRGHEIRERAELPAPLTVDQIAQLAARGDARIDLAYQMAIDEIASQRAGLDEMRSRVGVVLSGAAVATGFLAGQTLNTAHGIPGPAWVAIAAAVLLFVVCAAILRPVEWAGFEQNPRTVLIDAVDQPGRDINNYRANIANQLAGDIEQNRLKLGGKYRLFTACLGLLVIDFAGWIWTLATN